MGKFIGIDLGTTFSCMAYIRDDGQPEVIPNSTGERITPSAILFDEDETIVGEGAKQQSLLDPKDYAAFMKRHMGERDYVMTTKSGDTYTPEALSAIVLKRLKQDAEAYLGDTVEGVVITVPAYFNEAQRMATMHAGEIAGLKVLGSINEPTAAALAFGFSRGTEKPQTIMVYDLGGGTFDVTIMRFEGENITVLATAGDRKLGGFDFDNKIVEEVLEDAKDQGIDIAADPVARQDLQLKAEAAKKALSSGDKTKIVLNVGGRPYKYVLTREDFDDMVDPVVMKTIASMENACDEAGITYQDLDKILLVGGSTRMPVVKDMIREETGITPSSEVHPDEAVAIGAAYHVLDLAKAEEKKKPEERAAEGTDAAPGEEKKLDLPDVGKTYSFQDVTSHGIGVIAYDDEKNEDYNSVILPKNIKVPAEYSNVYSTTVAFQESLYLRITQGEEEDLHYVTVIGEAEIKVPPRETLVPVRITISCDVNSIIHVRVYDLDQNKDLGEMHIDRVSNLSEEEVKEDRIRINKLDISGE